MSSSVTETSLSRSQFGDKLYGLKGTIEAVEPLMSDKTGTHVMLRLRDGRVAFFLLNDLTAPSKADNPHGDSQHTFPLTKLLDATGVQVAKASSGLLGFKGNFVFSTSAGSLVSSSITDVSIGSSGSMSITPILDSNILISGTAQLEVDVGIATAFASIYRTTDGVPGAGAAPGAGDAVVLTSTFKPAAVGENIPINLVNSDVGLIAGTLYSYYFAVHISNAADQVNISAASIVGALEV